MYCLTRSLYPIRFQNPSQRQYSFIGNFQCIFCNWNYILWWFLKNPFLFGQFRWKFIWLMRFHELNNTANILYMINFRTLGIWNQSNSHPLFLESSNRYHALSLKKMRTLLICVSVTTILSATGKILTCIFI